MLFYMRYGFMSLISCPFYCIGMLLGGWYIILGVLVPFFALLIGDKLLPQDTNAYHPKYPHILNIWLYTHVIFNICTLILFMWRLSAFDLWGIGHIAQTYLNIPYQNIYAMHIKVIAVIFFVIFATGFTLGSNFLIAHELIHRKAYRFKAMGTFLLAIVLDTQFSLAHIYEHHVHVATYKDPATARRNESLYAFFMRSSIGQFMGAWHIEKNRLNKNDMHTLSINNRFLRGQLLTLILFCFIIWCTNVWIGFAFIAMGAYAKFLYEMVNYIQHYGLVRVENKPVESKHSWDCTAMASSFIFVNLTRHADHHAQANKPFWYLLPSIHELKLKHGYIACMLLAMFPSLWKAHMEPLLAFWDTHLASAEELKLIQQQTTTSHN
jgi:Fatty acid desaturase